MKYFKNKHFQQKVSLRADINLYILKLLTPNLAFYNQYVKSYDKISKFNILPPGSADNGSSAKLHFNFSNVSFYLFFTFS